MAEEDVRIGLGRACRHCGVRSETLGTVCPACGEPYAGRGGLLDRIPLLGGDAPDSSYFTVRLLFFVTIALAIGWVVLLLNDAVAGILVAAAAFVALVAGIGIANALNERGR